MGSTYQVPVRLWKPQNPESTQLWQLKELIEKKYDVKFEDYEALRQWSVTRLEEFWGEVWNYTGVKASQPYAKVLEGKGMFPRPAWFPGAKLNFAENLLYPVRCPAEYETAVIEANESSSNEVSWKALRERVRVCTLALRRLGVVKDDRVAGYLGNHCNTLVAMLAATSIGAIWTAVSPDTGVHAVLDRLHQIQPKVLFSDNAVVYNEKTHEVFSKTKEIVEGLSGLQALVVFETVANHPYNIQELKKDQVAVFMYDELLSSTDLTAPHEFAQLPADHPVYILYSSGTTGKPKCIVHGAIGTLIQHKKEHQLHCDLRPKDRLFYFTTVTWMMWHWLVSALATGTTIVLYDGSPFRPLIPPDRHGGHAMANLINKLSITHFGTSAKYLSMQEQKSVHLPPIKSLKAIYSTGSPLAPSTFFWVYFEYQSSINLASITGGTDIVSLFGAPNPIIPVYAGEIQCRGLGMAVETWDPVTGKDISSTGEAGELVCVKPFPCQPVAFWGTDGNEKYKSSYFSTFPDVWHHGDFVQIDPVTGGMIMLGRSDGVLKPSGVRFGSAEIYNVVLKHFASEVEDALCIGRRREQDTDEVVVLFLKMTSGSTFSPELADKIKAAIRQELSARHVPGIIDECPEIPVTTNGKKIEVAVKQILCGMKIRTSASVANESCLDWYKQWAEKHQD